MVMNALVDGVMSYQNKSMKQVQPATEAQVQVPEKNEQEAVSVKAADPSEKNSGESNKENAKENSPNMDALKKAVDQINKGAHSVEAQYGIHKETNRITIKIIDKETKKMIKEFPPEKTLDMIAKAWEIAGLLVDEKC